jgi:Tfp pilus assembly protein PilZ
MIQDYERRGNSRFNKVFSVYLSGAWGNAFGIARNISEGGMFIETLDPYPLGSQLRITFSFPGNEMEMTALGEVVHICFMNRSAGGSPRKLLLGMGVHFISFVPLSEDDVASSTTMIQ